MTKEGLDRAEIRAVVEEMGGKGVTEFVGSDVEGNSGLGEVFFENGVEGAGGEAFA